MGYKVDVKFFSKQSPKTKPPQFLQSQSLELVTDSHCNQCCDWWI